MFTSILIAFPLAVVATTQDASPTKTEKWTQEELERVAADIQADLEEMREAKFKRPVKVQTGSKQDFLDYVRRRQEKTETPERRARDETVAKMLGLIPPEMDVQAELKKLLEAQVGGFYDPSSDTFFIMDSFGGDLAKIILAHELTHALDDQYYDLDGKLAAAKEQSDAEFSLSALFEGSGTSAMNQWTFKRLKDLDKKALMESANVGTQGLDTAPALLWKPLIAAYLRGEGFLVHAEGMNIAMKAPTLEDVRRAFERPPRSSEQILHPAKYWDEEKLDEPRKIEFDASKRPEGWTVLGEDTLGEIYLAILTTPPDKRGGFDTKNPFAIIGLQFTNKAAEGWGGDRMLLLGKGDLRWLELVTIWDTPDDAREFFDLVKPGRDAYLPDRGLLARKVLHDEGSDAVVIHLLASKSMRPASDEELLSADLPWFFDYTLPWTAETKKSP